MTEPANSPTSRWQKAGFHLLLFFRFIQLGSVTITGFIYCYLVWHHNNHFCSYHPQRCTAEELSYTEVPWEFKVVITACTLAFLESYFSTTFFIHRRQINYRSLLLTTVPVAVFFGFAYRVLSIHPSTSLYCWFLGVPGSIKSDVEKKNCVIVVDGYVSLSIAAGFTAFIPLMSAFVVIYRSSTRRIMLPTEAAEDEFDKEQGLVNST